MTRKKSVYFSIDLVFIIIIIIIFSSHCWNPWIQNFQIERLTILFYLYSL
jgi:hypothetical protein